MSRYFVFATITLAIGAVTPPAAHAQGPPQAPGAASPTVPSEAPSSKPNTAGSNAQTDNAPLSKKLEEGEGVIKPPRDIDPSMHKDPPASTGDKMPIIVPPGEPGGDQSVQPK